MSQSFTREEVEAAPGVAILVMAKPTQDGDPAPMWERFVESEHIANPHGAAIRLWASVKGDWPGHEANVVMDPRARYLMWKHNMESWLGDGTGDVDSYLKLQDR